VNFGCPNLGRKVEFKSLAALINLALQAGIGLDGSSVANAPTQQDMGNNSQERCEAGHVVNIFY
jgi:hypothetical protein